MTPFRPPCRAYMPYQLSSLPLYLPPSFDFFIYIPQLFHYPSTFASSSFSIPYKVKAQNKAASMADISASSASAKRMWCSVPERTQLHLAMLALQFGYAGFHVVSRAALNMGISKIVFAIYRNIIALLLLLPFAYFLEKYAHCL